MADAPKHTPGPWFWAIDRHDNRTNLMRSGGGNCVVSPQCEIGNYGLSVHEWTDVSDADARLIETTPDLLDVARRFVAHYGVGTNSFLDEVYNAARAAIAKASGQ